MSKIVNEGVPVDAAWWMGVCVGVCLGAILSILLQWISNGFQNSGWYIKARAATII